MSCLRKYERDWLLNPNTKLHKHFSEIVLSGETRLVRHIFAMLPNDLYYDKSSLVKSGSQSLVLFYLKHLRSKKTEISVWDHLMTIGQTGYIDLTSLFTHKSDEARVAVQQGFTQLVYLNNPVRTYRVASILLKNGYITFWYPSLLHVNIQTLRLFRQYLGIHDKYTGFEISSAWAGQEDEIIRFIYLDESGLQGDINSPYLPQIIGDLRMSDSLAGELIKKSTGIRACPEITHHNNSLSKIESRVSLLQSYGIKILNRVILG